MTQRLCLLLLALLLAACNRTEPAVPAESVAEIATPAEAPSADEPAAPASATTAAPAQDAEAPATTPEAEAAAAQATAAAEPATLVAGTHYDEIKGGQPWQQDGRIEVVEVFGYVCPACAAFQPLVNAWKAKLPPDVRFTYVPAPFGPEWNPYAKAYYVAESMGLVERSHDALIRAIHVTQTMPGEGDGPDEQAIAQFYGQYGANPQEFLSTMNSFTVDAKVNRGKQFMLRSGVSSTPTLVVNGKYKVKGRSFEDMLRIASQLVARERASRTGAGVDGAMQPGSEGSAR